MVLTTTEFAKSQGVDYPIAMGFLNFLKAKGLVTVAGKRPASSGKGMPSIVYNVPEEVALTLKVEAPVAA